MAGIADNAPPVVEEPETPNLEGGRPACFSNTFQECLFVLTTTMAVGMASVLGGSTIGIVAAIGRDLHMTSGEITWINASSALTSGAFLLTFGQVADKFGRKRLFVLSMASFSVLVLITGFAKNAIYMDVFCGLLGLCSAAAVPPAVGALGYVYGKPSKRKNRAFACFSAGNPLGFVMGLLTSGITTRIFNWRASFWFLSLLYFLFTIAAIWTMPKDTQKMEKMSFSSLKRADLPGTFFAVVGIASLSSSFSLVGDAPMGWKTKYIIALLVCGVSLIAGFIAWENAYKYPIMPMYIWRDRNFSALMVILSLGFMGFIAFGFWVALYLQRIKELSALGVAVQLLPQCIGGIIVNIITALIMHRVNNKLLMLIGAIAYLASFLLVGFMKAQSSYWAFLFPALLLSVVGADIQFNVVNMYVMSSLPPAQQSLAGGIFNTFSKIVYNIGLGITTALYTSQGGTTASGGKDIRPYSTVFWFCAAAAGASIFLVPILNIKTQGGAPKQEKPLKANTDVEKLS